MNLHFLNLKKWFVLGLSLSLAVTSCQKNEDAPQELPSENQPAQTLPNKENQLILGKKLENPYSLANMQKARETLLQQNDSGIKLSAFATPLNATHYYVVFLPENDAHIKTLSELVSSKKFVTREHPMDYEVLQHGSEYRDTRTKDPKYPVLYASIPVNETMPNVPYEKLEDLYLPDEKNDPEEVLELSALYLVEQKEENDAPNMPKTAAMRTATLPKPQALFGIFNKSYYPQGRVHIETDTGTEPLRNAKIQIYNWFFDAYCKTDNNGFFRCSERFRREMGVYLTFDDDVTIRSSWNEIIGIRISDKIGNIDRGEHTFNIHKSDSHIWRKAMTHNAIQKFNEYIKSAGISQRATNLNIWVSEGGQQGAAPMFNRYYWEVTTNTLFANWFKWLSPISLPLTSVLGITNRHQMPDVYLEFSGTDHRRNESLVFHELAHTIHALQAGGSFWGDFVRRTTDNIIATGFDYPYGNGTEPSEWSGQNIALCEGWANFLEHAIVWWLSDFSAENSLEDFEMYTVPTNIRNSDSRIGGFYRGWFIHGLLWDLFDFGDHELFLKDPNDILFWWGYVPAPDRPILLNGETRQVIPNPANTFDNVSLSVNDIFKALHSNVRTPAELKERLQRNHPNEATAIENLFNAYGY